MADNENLKNAKSAKDDEFYTLYEDIEKEMNAYVEYNPDVFRDKTILLPCDDPEWSNFTKYFVANFNRFGLKKLISTSYANESKTYKTNWQPTLFEIMDPGYDEYKSPRQGKIFTLTRRNRNVNKDDLKWKYLKGNGDFRSDEVKALRDEADIIITNPPFSLFREFLKWIMDAEKHFIVICNKNAFTFKEVFLLIKENQVWIGHTVPNNFITPDGEITKKENSLCRWLTNIDTEKRHEIKQLMTMADNLKYNKPLIRKLPLDDEGKPYYPKYVNYDAIEVPVVEGIPKDYSGEMGVPITFLDTYNPSQFEIVGASLFLAKSMKNIASKGEYMTGGNRFYTDEQDGKYKYKRKYDRLVIKAKVLEK